MRPWRTAHLAVTPLNRGDGFNSADRSEPLPNSGHGGEAVEIHLREFAAHIAEDPTSRMSRPASIRPRPWGRGDGYEPARPRPYRPGGLQIRPRHLSRGEPTHSSPAVLRTVGWALQFGHGGEAVENRFLVIQPLHSPHTYESELQFGHGGEAVENSRTAGLARVRGSKLQFGHGRGAVETLPNGPQGTLSTPSERFNSATAVRPWRCLRTGIARGRSHSDRFNSATAVRPWKTHLCLTDSGAYDTSWLQFGHGGEAVENVPSNFALATAWEPLLLQFGHGRGAVETNWPRTGRGAVRKQASSFNSATAVTVESAAVAEGRLRNELIASIRPRR